MSIANHVGIFLRGSLDQPRPSKTKAAPHYYAQVALPPQATPVLHQMMQDAAPNGRLAGLHLGVQRNSEATKPFDGVPPDWLILRVSSGADYPPELFAADGEQVAAVAVNGSRLREEFYAGQRVRLNAYAFPYEAKNGGKAGIGWNLSGLMAVGGGERLAISGGGVSSASAFADYLPSAASRTASPEARTGSSRDEPGRASRQGDPFLQTGGPSGAFTRQPPPMDTFLDDDAPF